VLLPLSMWDIAHSDETEVKRKLTTETQRHG
jgi:hypothetical protein